MPTLTLESLQLFLFFVVPGFVALKTYELLVPGRKTSSKILDVVTYSMINLGISFPAIWLSLALDEFGLGAWYVVLNVVLTFFVVLVLPAAVAIGIYRLRMSSTVNQWMQHPLSSAWDFVFQQKREWFLILHTRDGKMIGGRFGKHSFASDAFGAGEGRPDLFIEETWFLEDNGVFREKGNSSLLIRMSDCREIEFLEVHEKDSR